METKSTVTMETLVARQQEIISLLVGGQNIVVQPLRPEEAWVAEYLPAIVVGGMSRREGYFPKALLPEWWRGMINIGEVDFVMIHHIPRIPGATSLIRSLKGRIPVFVTGLPEELAKVSLDSKTLPLLPMEYPVEDVLQKEVARVMSKTYSRKKRKLFEVIAFVGALGVNIPFDHLAAAVGVDPDEVGTMVEELHKEKLLLWSEEKQTPLTVCLHGGEAVARRLLNPLELNFDSSRPNRALPILLKLISTVDEDSDFWAMSRVLRTLAVNPIMRRELLREGDISKNDISTLLFVVELFRKNTTIPVPPIFEGIE